MIDVYAVSTPNSVKIPIALEELGLDYTLHGVNIRARRRRQISWRLIPTPRCPCWSMTTRPGRR
jgi:glutathione S-transferase